MGSTGTQLPLDLDVRPTVAEMLARIRSESRDETEKGRWFEQLVMTLARQTPEWELVGIWHWADWPDREKATGLDGRDIGIDLVAQRTTGEWVAIQCKCYDENHRVPKSGVDSFLGGSQNQAFELRWIVATCNMTGNAWSAIKGANPPVSVIDFRQFLQVQIEAAAADRPVQELWPLQDEAVEDVVEGLSNHGRGRLVMACGTGKTFTSLRITERIVPDGGRILFAAPTIALVSQARREWLRQTVRPLDCIVVCSDSTAGGRRENEDIGISELECPVSTNPEVIAKRLAAGNDRTHVVFCTYHSLSRVMEAQTQHGAPGFDLAIADEAHRTTGVVRSVSDDGPKVDFQAFHDADRLRACKRLYMTATPRIYTERSKSRLAKAAIEVVDMGALDVYGPEFHRLPFAKAVEHQMLSDYRVIVLGVNEASVTPAMRRRLEKHGTDVAGSTGNGKTPKRPTTNDMTRVLGVSLAVNGITEGAALDQPGRLPRTMAFANSIRRSEWYSKALTDSLVKSATTRRLHDGTAMNVTAVHLDASASALKRNQELRALANAGNKGEGRLICNVKLFTEGVDVPQLDAVAFLDPRDSQVDVVQAVGRVMRKAEGKRFGYIIVPVVVPPGGDVAAALEKSADGYKTVGRVLRALQAHDGRLAESIASFVQVYEPENGNGNGSGGVSDDDDDTAHLQGVLELRSADAGIYAHVAAASGLGKPGQIVADEIVGAVRHASAMFANAELEDSLANALGLATENDGGAKGVCTIAALMLCNACLLQRRLRDEPGMEMIMRLDKVAGARIPGEMLAAAWDSILEKDYKPVFLPALAVLKALGEREAAGAAIRTLAECANRVADSLSELGYDHAGPLYHRILGSAKSDGAFYTNNVSAIMLARLAFTEGFTNWSDPKAVAGLRIMDPACGTGTLLMATLRAIKERAQAGREMSEEDRAALHRGLVENVLCGLDINRHGVQLAACNMTLGAPTVDYARMNLATMAHGPQGNGEVRSGSLEILNAAKQQDLNSLYSPLRELDNLDADQVDEASKIDFPLRGLDAVIMNPPFTDNRKRSRKFDKASLKLMQECELAIRDALEKRDSRAAGVITTNSVRTFFTPLAEQLLHEQRGILAKVLPATGCIGASGLAERRFLARCFHVECVVTSHDPRKIAFSENTSIHECLLICRRHPEGERPPTAFVSLAKMPTTAEQAVAAADAIASGRPGEWGRVCMWPADRIGASDWSPVQWFDGTLADAAYQLENHPDLVPAKHVLTTGATGQAAQDSWRRPAESAEGRPDQVRVFDSVSAKIRRRMLDEPEQSVVPGGRRAHLFENVLATSGHLMLVTRYNTNSGRLTALWSETATFGFGWIPASVMKGGHAYEQALCAWWNSTAGRVLLLNRRAKTLTYPKWSVEHLTSLPCPRPDSLGSAALARAWKETCRMPLLPLCRGAECKVRRRLDEAAAVVIGVDPNILADWRQCLAAEPTITNRPAAE